MIIDFRSRPPFKSYATNTLLFPRKTDIDFAPGEEIPALNKFSGEMESARKCDMGLYFEERAKAGIDIGVVHGRQSLTDGFVPNSEIAELLELYPDKFIGFGALELQRPNSWREEIARCKSYGFKGISIEPGYNLPPMYFDDPLLETIYEGCIEHDLVISLTSSVFVGPDISYTDPVHIQRVANKYKNLKIAVDHGCWPYVAGILGISLICPNIYLYPDFYGYIPNMPFAEEFVKAANYYLEDRFLFGSGYPIRSMIQAVEQFKNCNFRPEIMDKLLYENAKKLLKL